MYKNLIAIISIAVVFKSILKSLNIDYIIYILCGIVIYFTFLKLIFKGTLYRSAIIWILPFIAFNLIQFILTSINYSLIIAAIGIFGSLYNLVLWFLSFSGNKKKFIDKYLYYYIRLLIILGIITAIFAIYQYHFDITLFNFNQHPKYGNIILIESGKITKRVGSFIGSPQNFGLFMGIVLSLLVFYQMNLKIKIFLFLLIGYAGILSGSGAFTIFVCVFFVCWHFHSANKNKRVLILLIAFGLSVIMYYIQKTENINDTWLGGFYIADMWTATYTGYSRLNIYSELLEFKNVRTFFFGHGIGLTDRLVEIVLKDNVPNYCIFKNESYLIKQFYEIGFLGLLAFIIPYLIAIIKSYKNLDRLHKFFFAFLIAIFSNFLFTPSFSGLSISFFVWPFFLYPLLKGYSKQLIILFEQPQLKY